MEEKLSLRSNALLERKRRRLRILLGILVLAPLILTATGAYISRLPNLSIERVYVYGNVAVSTEDILSLIRVKLDGNYLYAFPRHNVLLYPKDDIASSILERFPRLATASIGFRDFQSISIEVTERRSLGIWCGNSPEEKGDCYFLDGEGLLFAKAPKFSGNVFLEYYGHISSSTPLRANFLSKEELQRTKYLLHELERLELVARSFYARGETTREIKFGSGGKVIFESTKDYGSMLRDLEALLQSEPFKGFDRNSFALDYIDLRLGNKVFYKKR